MPALWERCLDGPLRGGTYEICHEYVDETLRLHSSADSGLGPRTRNNRYGSCRIVGTGHEWVPGRAHHRWQTGESLDALDEEREAFLKVAFHRQLLDLLAKAFELLL